MLANASSLMSAELANRHLLDALASRDVIGQAKGILMARHGMTADQAFDDLRRASQRHGRKLGDVAADVVEVVERLALGPPGDRRSGRRRLTGVPAPARSRVRTPTPRVGSAMLRSQVVASRTLVYWVIRY